MNALKSAMAVVATMFMQFRHPATNALVFAKDPVTGEDDLTKPMGVKMYSPGSKQYRAAEDAVNTQSVKDGKKGLTGEKIRENATKVMARTVTEFVNFDYNGLSPNGLELAEREAINKQLLDDVEYVAVRDQIAAYQADLGNASATPTSV